MSETLSLETSPAEGKPTNLVLLQPPTTSSLVDKIYPFSHLTAVEARDLLLNVQQLATHKSRPSLVIQGREGRIECYYFLQGEIVSKNTISGSLAQEAQ